ncbi:MAG: DUF4913 domain-containing protein [Nakamurella sp.]
MSLADELAELDQADHDDQGETQPANLYNSVHEFVTDFIAQIYAHPVADRQTSWRWCSHWHHHAEAVARLEAAWKAFEALRQDPGTGASVWFRDHGDPCMTALTGSDGPFRLCSDTGHKAPTALPCQPLETGPTEW